MQIKVKYKNSIPVKKKNKIIIEIETIKNDSQNTKNLGIITITIRALKLFKIMENLKF